MQNLHRIVSRISSISPLTTRSSIPWRNCSTVPSSNPNTDTANEHDSWARSWQNIGSSGDSDFDSVFSLPSESTESRLNEEDSRRQSVCEIVSVKHSTIKDKRVRVDWGSVFSRLTELAKKHQVIGKIPSVNEGCEFAMVEEVLDDALKDKMYKLHKENPEVYTIDKLAIYYGIMPQRVYAVLFLKELEEEEEEMKKLGRSLDDYVKMLLDVFPEFLYPRYSEEFNACSDLTVMHEGWNELLEILRKCAMKCQSRRMKCFVEN